MTNNTDALSAGVFDLAAALSDISYGEETVTIFLNEGEGRAIAEGQETIDSERLAGNEDIAKSLEGLWSARAEAFAKTALEVRVAGISPQEQKAIAVDAVEKYPTKRNSFGIEEENLVQDTYFTEQTWLAYIKSIGPVGGTPDQNITLDKVRMLLAKAPRRAQTVIANAIKHRTDSTDWFVQSASSVDFS